MDTAVIDVRPGEPQIGPCETCHEKAYVTIHLHVGSGSVGTVSGCANCKTGPFAADSPFTA